MDLEARKISLVQEFLRIDNEKIISALENFIRSNKQNNPEKEINPMSLEQFNKEIDEAILDEKNNRVISAEDLKQKIQQWS